MKKKILFYLLLLLSIFLVCCGKSAKELYPTDPAPDGGDIYYEPSPSISYEGMDGAIAGKTEGLPAYSDAAVPETEGDVDPDVVIPDDPKTEEPIMNNEPQSGQLTASVVFDNDHYAFWKSLISKGQDETGLFYDYNSVYPFDTSYRFELHTGVAGLKVIMDGKYSGVTNATGRVYLFPKKAESHTIDIYNGKNKVDSLTFDGNPEEITMTDIFFTMNGTSPIQLKEKIQIAFVIDTTGSMGDEINYLKSELKSVINRVKGDLENIEIEIALVFYRDYGDDYVTLVKDFTNDIDLQQEALKKQYADGGGDWEEAVQVAFKDTNKLSWDDEAKTKLVVFVADAPCHREDAQTVVDETNKFAEKGIRVITVASSGIDKGTEFLFRSICLVTNGAYGYLTNDSGIGGYHVEATTEEKPVVEYLNAMLVRLIEGFHTGEFADAVPWRGVQIDEEGQNKKD